MKLGLFAICAFSLLGCGETLNMEQCGSAGCGESNESVENMEAAQIESKISVGMERSKVIEILGEGFETYYGANNRPIVDSFPYRAGKTQKYLYVRYENNKVFFFKAGFDEPYRVY